MSILALEFSTSHRSVAVLAGGASAERCGLACEGVTRETPAFSLIQTALAAAGVTRSEITVIVVGLGPGSSTGIRSAIAIAQGWQVAQEVRLLGLGSLEAMAAPLQAAGRRGRVHLAVDAQRREFHVATYDLDPTGAWSRVGLRIESAATLEGWMRNGEPVLGPELAAPLHGASDLWPEALTLARLASGSRDVTAAGNLEPIHLRGLTFVKAPPSAARPEAERLPDLREGAVSI